jgi:uncharacterized cupin superfamily protein
VQRVNVFEVEVHYDGDDPEGYKTGYARLGPLLGAAMLGGSIYVLAPEQSICPYHYEYGNEEWLIVLEGPPTYDIPKVKTSSSPGTPSAFRSGRTALTR